eukprot:CAMPEP_0119534214 /NCGR_PEP_ID=MMETSP1344-20130328/47488_1 /TAXON_ID=236787 /ORGANISM="Florenciella parvula, Strain CCMP2471" /LENGTH=45 /DNA_ID= /DNA_START= /DNA_END= /DNA_ORIENTATION=
MANLVAPQEDAGAQAIDQLWANLGAGAVVVVYKVGLKVEKKEAVQ